MRPLISVIMPTYNSERTIRCVLDALSKQQSLDGRIELLVIDGGSTDSTLEIAKEHGAKIISNERRLPEFAKLIGFQNASGRYVVKLDSDEELVSIHQLKKRVDYLLAHPNVKAMVADCLLPVEGCGVSASYLNLYGDPFTKFVYRSKGSVRKSFSAHLEEDTLSFSEGDLIPIGDSGSTTLDLDYIKEQFPDRICEASFACSCFNDVVARTRVCGCIQGDDVRHHSQASLKTYFKKLHFRVVNNIFSKEESGFSSRESSLGGIRWRKLLFPLYALCVPLPVVDAIVISVRHRDASLLLHVLYVYYVCLDIAYCLFMKMAGKSLSNSTYG